MTQNITLKVYIEVKVFYKIGISNLPRCIVLATMVVIVCEMKFISLLQSI